MTEHSRVVDWPPPRRPPRRNRGGLIVLAVLAAIMFGGGTALSYYVESLWFDSLGYIDVFWTTLNIAGGVVFSAFFAVTFLVLYGAYRRVETGATRRAHRRADPHQRPADPAARRTGPAPHRARRLARDRLRHGRRHDGQLADAGGLLVRPGTLRRTRSSIRSSRGRSTSICSRCRRGR